MAPTGGIVAAVLAGGLGTRLQSVVSDRQKTMAAVQGAPFLSYVLDEIVAAGIRETVLCVGYMADSVSSFYGEKYRELHLSYSREKEPMGTAGALKLAEQLLTSDPVLVLNGDSLCIFDMTPFFEHWAVRRPEGLIATVKVRDTGRFGSVSMDSRGNIVEFKEKDASVGPGFINAGMYLLSQNIIKEIPAGKACSIEREIFPGYCDGRLLGYTPPHARFIDIGTPDSFAAANKFISQETCEQIS